MVKALRLDIPTALRNVANGGLRMYKFAEPNACSCPLCGTALNPGAVICVGCGAKKKTGAVFIQCFIVGLIAYVLYSWCITSDGWGAMIASIVVMGLTKILLRKQVRWVH